MSQREIDLGRLLEQVGRRLQHEGQGASQRFYEWEREERLPMDSTRGGGNGGSSTDDRLREQREDRQASRLRGRWVSVRHQLDALGREAVHLLDEARSERRPLDKHRTPAQVEADGWCGNHWARGGELVPISLRPSGEPYYRGRCRACGAWPGGDPPAEVLATWRKGATVRVKAS